MPDGVHHYDEAGNRARITSLRDKGVDVWGPERVYIAPDVKLERIEAGARIRHATLEGSKLLIGAETEIGASGHARVSDCQIGRNVSLGAGTYEGATILDRSSIRGWAEIRPGTLIEEEVEAAHTVAFKNTVLTATCVTGSVLNYCDLFMSGGTSRSNHSEVGSGVVHFNFDPRGDKWGSLLGDARGALLLRAPVFVGGQVGLVAPVSVGFGAVLAAGSLVRRDVDEDCVHFEQAENQRIRGFDREVYTGLRRKLVATARLVGSLWALDAWYEQVRTPFADSLRTACYVEAREQLAAQVAERVKRLGKLIAKLPRSLHKTEGRSEFEMVRAEHRLLIEKQVEIMAAFENPGAPPPPVGFVTAYEQARRSNEHVAAVQSLNDAVAAQAEDWIGAIAAEPERRLGALLG